MSVSSVLTVHYGIVNQSSSMQNTFTAELNSTKRETTCTLKVVLCGRVSSILSPQSSRDDQLNSKCFLEITNYLSHYHRITNVVFPR